MVGDGSTRGSQEVGVEQQSCKQTEGAYSCGQLGRTQEEGSGVLDTTELKAECLHPRGQPDSITSFLRSYVTPARDYSQHKWSHSQPQAAGGLTFLGALSSSPTMLPDRLNYLK